MKSIIKIFSGIIVSIILLGCPGEDLGDNIVATLRIKNSSLKSVVYLPNYINKESLNDTLLLIQDSHWYNDAKYTIGIDTFSSFKIAERMKDAIDTKYNLLIYFFDTDTILQVPWERIATENIILKRVDIHSWEELESLNFEISYP